MYMEQMYKCEGKEVIVQHTKQEGERGNAVGLQSEG